MNQTGWNRGKLSSLKGRGFLFFIRGGYLRIESAYIDKFLERIVAVIKEGLALFFMDFLVFNFGDWNRFEPAKAKSIDYYDYSVIIP